MTERAGLMMAMMQPPPTMEEEFQDWYDTEHFPERANCEGFVTAQRMLCLDGFPRYLALYDLTNRAVLDGPGYGAIARNRYSQWTKRIIPRMWGALSRRGGSDLSRTGSPGSQRHPDPSGALAFLRRGGSLSSDDR